MTGDKLLTLLAAADKIEAGEEQYRCTPTRLSVFPPDNHAHAHGQKRTRGDAPGDSSQNSPTLLFTLPLFKRPSVGGIDIATPPLLHPQPAPMSQTYTPLSAPTGAEPPAATLQAMPTSLALRRSSIDTLHMDPTPSEPTSPAPALPPSCSHICAPLPATNAAATALAPLESHRFLTPAAPSCPINQPYQPSAYPRRTSSSVIPLPSGSSSQPHVAVRRLYSASRSYGGAPSPHPPYSYYTPPTPPPPPYYAPATPQRPTPADTRPNAAAIRVQTSAEAASGAIASPAPALPPGPPGHALAYPEAYDGAQGKLPFASPHPHPHPQLQQPQPQPQGSLLAASASAGAMDGGWARVGSPTAASLTYWPAAAAAPPGGQRWQQPCTLVVVEGRVVRSSSMPAAPARRVAAPPAFPAPLLRSHTGAPYQCFASERGPAPITYGFGYCDSNRVSHGSGHPYCCNGEMADWTPFRYSGCVTEEQQHGVPSAVAAAVLYDAGAGWHEATGAGREETSAVAKLTAAPAAAAVRSVVPAAATAKGFTYVGATGAGKCATWFSRSCGGMGQQWQPQPAVHPPQLQPARRPSCELAQHVYGWDTHSSRLYHPYKRSYPLRRFSYSAPCYPPSGPSAAVPSAAAAATAAAATATGWTLPCAAPFTAAHSYRCPSADGGEGPAAVAAALMPGAVGPLTFRGAFRRASQATTAAAAPAHFRTMSADVALLRGGSGLAACSGSSTAACGVLQPAGRMGEEARLRARVQEEGVVGGAGAAGRGCVAGMAVRLHGLRIKL